MASMMMAAGNTGPEIALFERISVMLHRPKVTTIVTARMMAVFARLVRGGGGGAGFCSGSCGVGGVLIRCSGLFLDGKRRVS